MTDQETLEAVPLHLIIFAPGDGCMIVLQGDAPHDDFDCLGPGAELHELSIQPDSHGLWLWVDEGSTSDDEGYESWRGHWRRMTTPELLIFACGGPLHNHAENSAVRTTGNATS